MTTVTRPKPHLPDPGQTERGDTFLAVSALAGFPVIVATTIGTLVLVGAWYGFVVYKLYGWFVVPLGAPVLNWWHIWGLLFVYNTAVNKPSKTSDKTTGQAVGDLVGRVLALALVLLLGWLIHGQI